MIVGNIRNSEGSDILILELTDEEAYVASMLLNEEIYTVEDLIDKFHKVDDSSSEIDKQDAANISHQLDVMRSIANKLNK
ncbi:MAG TPA: hypothetical protein PL107_01410 [Candidatus Marinimicrobia bacterium]|nr:hypothetical protein [Candidatus Neomarinimicrobiota bacterium]HRD17799.1 hypothetical protein [Candidatus Neomarinimicrobiota bacterium]